MSVRKNPISRSSRLSSLILQETKVISCFVWSISSIPFWAYFLIFRVWSYYRGHTCSHPKHGISKLKYISHIFHSYSFHFAPHTRFTNFYLSSIIENLIFLFVVQEIQISFIKIRGFCHEAPSHGFGLLCTQWFWGYLNVSVLKSGDLQHAMCCALTHTHPIFIVHEICLLRKYITP